MTAPQPEHQIYSLRIRRAQYLRSKHPFAAQVLEFYEAIASFQANLFSRLTAVKKNSQESPSLLLRQNLDLSEILPHMRAFLLMVREKGPTPLADSAGKLVASSPDSWVSLLTAYWNNGGLEPSSIAHDEFIARAMLQPYLELLALQSQPNRTSETPSLCPLCGSQPLLGILRPEGDGGKRFLLCSFCSHEWAFRRILCVSCGEETEQKLPVFVAEQFPYMRTETCESCLSYLRTVDLTKDGNAIPLIDDLVALPLSLWAHERGYSRLQFNLLGT